MSRALRAVEATLVTDPEPARGTLTGHAGHNPGAEFATTARERGRKPGE